MIRVFTALIALFYCFISLKTSASEFAISPMIIEKDMAAGATEDFEFQIHGKKDGVANIFLNDLKQEATGHMAFNGEEASTAELATWISLEKNKVRVRQGETITIGGKIKLPRRGWGKAGSRVAAIMVEQERDPSQTGISLNVRYAIIIAINVSGKKIRFKTDYELVGVEKQNGRYYVTAWFTNKSNKDGRLESLAYMRDGNKKLVGKLPLKTKSAWQRGDEWSRVFPGARVKVYGLLDESFNGLGDFSLMAKSRFASRRLPSKKMKLSLDEESFKEEEKESVAKESDADGEDSDGNDNPENDSTGSTDSTEVVETGVDEQPSTDKKDISAVEVTSAQEGVGHES